MEQGGNISTKNDLKSTSDENLISSYRYIVNYLMKIIN